MDRKSLLAFDAIEEVPQQDVSQHDGTWKKRFPRFKWLYSGGTRGGVGYCAVAVTVVLAINLTFTLGLGVGGDFGQGTSAIFTGSCSKERSYSTIAHLFINTFSTILLSASNYCMQCLVAPTRTEVDAAHQKGKTFDIGIPSIRNLFKIGYWKPLFWVVLCVSSVPLHLFYNSAIVSAIAANDYLIMSVNNAFVTQTETFHGQIDSPSWVGNYTLLAPRLQYLAATEQMEKLDLESCIKAYSVNYLSSRSNLLLVTPISTDNSSTPKVNNWYLDDNTIIDDDVSDGCPPNPYPWICSDQPCTPPCDYDMSEVLDNLSDWTPLGYPVDYCLSQITPEQCELRLNLHIMTVVIIANALKILAMVTLMFWLGGKPFLNLGDAISSFLAKADPTTIGCCLLGRGSFDRVMRGQRWNSLAQTWNRDNVRWHRSVSGTLWLVFIVSYTLAVCACIGLLAYGRSQIIGPHNISALFSLGIGAVNTETLINWQIPSIGASGLMKNVIISNSPQLVLSFIYFTLNAILTRMVSGKEWSDYSNNRKGLRVSQKPQGQQRSTYFLQLPYRYSVPLMGLSALLHWLVSQSFFLVAVERFDPSGLQYDANIAKAGNHTPCDEETSICLPTPTHLTCGWSPAAIISIIIVAAIVIAACIYLATKRYKPEMPIMRNSSAAISAACHPLDEATKINVGVPVQWGVVQRATEMTPGHCSFTTGFAELPEEGKLYS